MKRLLVIISLIFILLPSCSNTTNNEQSDIIKNLDQQIAERVNRINSDIECRITQRVNTYLNPQNIQDSINKFIQLGEKGQISEVVTTATLYLNNVVKYYDLKQINFVPFNKQSDNVILKLKLNELLLLDNILLGGHNKIARSTYSGICVPTIQTDSIMSFDVFLLKIDTIRTPQIRIKSERIKNDSVYIPIIGGIGKIEFSDDFKHKNLDFTTSIDCKIGNRDTAIVAKFPKLNK